MKSLPLVASIQPPVETDDQQTNFYAWLAATRQLLGGGVPQSKTIASGTFTPDEDKTFLILVDTEAAAISDDLDRLATTNIPDGALVLLQAANTARTVVVRHAQSGTGQFLLHGAANFSLDDTEKMILLRYNLSATTFVELVRSWGGDAAAQRASLGLGTAALVNTGTGDSDVPTNLQIFKTARDYTRQQRFIRVALTDAASITWDLDTQQVAKVTLGGNRTLANPSNKKDGGSYSLWVYQDATGGRTLAYGSDYKWINGTAPVIGTGANDLTILSFESDGTIMVGVTPGTVPL